MWLRVSTRTLVNTEKFATIDVVQNRRHDNEWSIKGYNLDENSTVILYTSESAEECESVLLKIFKAIEDGMVVMDLKKLKDSFNAQ